MALDGRWREREEERERETESERDRERETERERERRSVLRWADGRRPEAHCGDLDFWAMIIFVFFVATEFRWLPL